VADGTVVRKKRTDAERQVAELLRTVKESLGLSVAFLTRMDGTTQTLEVVESSVPLLFLEGAEQAQDSTFCQAILDGKLPAVIPDVGALPEARRLPAARFPRVRSFVSVPVTLSDGSLYGTLCAAALTADKGLTKRDQSLMDVLASAAAVIIEPGVREAERVRAIRHRLDPVMAAGGPTVVLQPIVSLRTGERIGAEALSRFPPQWSMAPDACFEEAHSVGRGVRLELQALARAARLLDQVGGYVAMNVSPGTLLDPECLALFGRLDASRLLVELSEHDPVEDYEALSAALKPLRDRGAKLAIDDVGAGFSSLRHIVLTSPDVIKVDRTIAAGLAADPVLHTLVAALVQFAHGSGASVVAEGIETEDDALALRELDVDSGQGWLFGRPGPVEALDDTPVWNPPRAVVRPRVPGQAAPRRAVGPAD
jgi:EAL domain-containing protein (putative c-di-GMP-specific phosphodiesterase class I)